VERAGLECVHIIADAREYAMEKKSAESVVVSADEEPSEKEDAAAENK
jgi:hypothetical protein